MIQLRFITGNSLVSWLIRQVTWAEYSHVDLILPGEGLLGAQGDGVKIRPFDYCKPTKIAVGEIDWPPDVEAKFIAFARAQVGKPYDYSALWGNLLHRDWHDPRAWYCSEVFAADADAIGHPLITGQFNRVDPGMLARSPLIKLSILSS